MSVLIDSSITIYDALQNIKNGKYVKLNSYAAYRGSDIGNCGEPDGCFGDKTAYMVRWFQGVIVFEHGYSSGYTQDGIVGKLTMRKLDDVVGHIV